MSKTGIIIDPDTKRAEQQRLADHFVHILDGGVTYEDAQRTTKSEAEGFGQITATLVQAALALDALSSDDDPVALVRAVRARHGDDPSLAQLCAYRIELEFVALQCRKLAADMEGVAVKLVQSLERTSGNQSTLPLRMMTFAAATAYLKLTGREPGLSRSDDGPFGRFVREAIELIPRERRPLPPSPAAIADVVKAWRKSEAVRNWKAALKRQAEA